MGQFGNLLLLGSLLCFSSVSADGTVLWSPETGRVLAPAQRVSVVEEVVRVTVVSDLFVTVTGIVSGPLSEGFSIAMQNGFISERDRTLGLIGYDIETRNLAMSKKDGKTPGCHVPGVNSSWCDYVKYNVQPVIELGDYVRSVPLVNLGDLRAEILTGYTGFDSILSKIPSRNLRGAIYYNSSDGILVDKSRWAKSFDSMKNMMTQNDVLVKSFGLSTGMANDLADIRALFRNDEGGVSRLSLIDTGALERFWAPMEGRASIQEARERSIIIPLGVSVEESMVAFELVTFVPPPQSKFPSNLPGFKLMPPLSGSSSMFTLNLNGSGWYRVDGDCVQISGMQMCTTGALSNIGDNPISLYKEKSEMVVLNFVGGSLFRSEDCGFPKSTTPFVWVSSNINGDQYVDCINGRNTVRRAHPVRTYKVPSIIGVDTSTVGTTTESQSVLGCMCNITEVNRSIAIAIDQLRLYSDQMVLGLVSDFNLNLSIWLDHIQSRIAMMNATWLEGIKDVTDERPTTEGPAHMSTAKEQLATIMVTSDVGTSHAGNENTPFTYYQQSSDEPSVGDTELRTEVDWIQMQLRVLYGVIGLLGVWTIGMTMFVCKSSSSAGNRPKAAVNHVYEEMKPPIRTISGKVKYPSTTDQDGVPRYTAFDL